MREVEIGEICRYMDENGWKYRADIQDGSAKIRGFSSLDNYKPGTVTWVKSKEKAEGKDFSKVALVVVQEGIDVAALNVIKCENSKGAFFGMLSHFWCDKQQPDIASTAVIETERIGSGVSIGHYSFICKNVEIGDHVIIENNVHIQCPCKIGEGTHIWSGVVIGTDGFGYYDLENGGHDKVPHFGGVAIGRNVEIGANTCIDRGTLDDTRIGDGVKIDNLCHIGHNVQIGKNTMVIALSMLGGSSVLEENVYCAPGVMVMNQARMERNSMAGMGAVVTKDVPENQVVVGIPAKYLKDRY